MARLSKFSAICHTCGKHNRFNKGQAIFANIQSGEQRYFKIMKYVKNEDKCDMTIFNSKRVLMYK